MSVNANSVTIQFNCFYLHLLKQSQKQNANVKKASALKNTVNAIIKEINVAQNAIVLIAKILKTSKKIQFKLKDKIKKEKELN